MNSTHHYQHLSRDDHHLPVLGQHSADILKAHTQHISNQNKSMQLNSVHDPTSEAYLEHRELIKTEHKEVWTNSFANELGRLSQGYDKSKIKGRNTLSFIN